MLQPGQVVATIFPCIAVSGLEFVTDFVLRRLDNEYVLVEIEKPHDKLFGRGSDFSSKFTHAFGQILGFQEWVDENPAYARKFMPGIPPPRGLPVLGRGN